MTTNRSGIPLAVRVTLAHAEIQAVVLVRGVDPMRAQRLPGTLLNTRPGTADTELSHLPTLR